MMASIADPLVLRILGGAPGSGKSFSMRQEAADTPGLYAFCYPAIELLEEQFAEFRKLSLPTWKVHSGTSGRMKVQAQLEQRLAEIAATGITHGVLVMTHSALTNCDLSPMGGWHWRIDEAPVIHRSGIIRVSKAERTAWRSAIRLLDSSGGWSRAVYAGDTLNVRELKASLFAKHGDFLLAAKSGSAFVRTEDWKAGNHYWLSLWTPLALPSPLSIEIGGAGFSRSISAALLGALFEDQIVLKRREAQRPRTGQPQVRIHYFARWEASSSHWDTHDGRDDLKRIAAHIREAQPDLGYWSANEEPLKLLDHYISPEKGLRPRLAGLNRHHQHRSCAIIYSSKSTPEDDVLLGPMKFTPEQIRVAREDEDIFQFVFRGAIRQPDYDGPYDIYLFSREQAERLEGLLRDVGLEQITLIHEAEAGVTQAKPESPKRGRPSKYPGETAIVRNARLAKEQSERRRKHQRN